LVKFVVIVGVEFSYYFQADARYYSMLSKSHLGRKHT